MFSFGLFCLNMALKNTYALRTLSSVVHIMNSQYHYNIYRLTLDISFSLIISEYKIRANTIEIEC